MRTSRRRRTTWAIALSVLAHAVVLVTVLLQRPVRLPTDDAGPDSRETVIPVLIMPKAPNSRAGGPPQPSAVRQHVRAQPPESGGPRLSPSPTAPGPAVSERQAIPGQAPPAAGPSVPDLRQALRHGAVGCANLGTLSRAERERCDEQFGRDLASAPVLRTPLEPRIRAYYDAVAETKAPFAMPMHRASFDPPSEKGGHIPLVGCYVPFGPGKPRKLPTHWLTLGRCFIAPPKGSLTPEADLTPPDQDMNPR